jgi:hypothetical protein
MERKEGRTGYVAIEHCKADDWRIACQEWIDRREAKKNEKAA